MDKSILSIRSVSKHYKDKTALEDINIEIPEGSIYGLLGPNGAGKTSLIRIINQITSADTGEILLNGELLNQSHIRDIGYLPEERGLYKKIKVVKQLRYFAELRGLSSSEANIRAHSWLERMNLLDVKNKKIEELSKGMQQKVQFIVSVINNPKLLILDEPFSGFDPVNAELLTSIILELKAKGCTIIFSTHRMESVEKLCDYMALIHLSKKILDGEVSAIRKQFSGNTFELISNSPIVFTSNGLEIINSVETKAGQIKHLIQLNGLSVNDCIREAMSQSELISFNQFVPSIHDIFIQLVSEK